MIVFKALRQEGINAIQLLTAKLVALKVAHQSKPVFQMFYSGNTFLLHVARTPSFHLNLSLLANWTWLGSPWPQCHLPVEEHNKAIIFSNFLNPPIQPHSAQHVSVCLCLCSSMHVWWNFSGYIPSEPDMSSSEPLASSLRFQYSDNFSPSIVSKLLKVRKH